MEIVRCDPSALGRVKAIVAKVLEILPEEVSSDLEMYGHPKWDSLAHIDIILELEQEFQLTVDDNLYTCLKTVAEIGALIGALNAAR